MELKSLKKKYKAKGFAAGCSREVIARGAEQLGWGLSIQLEYFQYSDYSVLLANDLIEGDSG